MKFPVLLYLLPFVAALATSLVMLPLWRKWCFRLGLVDDPGQRKLHESPVALAGGPTLMTALMLPAAAAVIALSLVRALGAFGADNAPAHAGVMARLGAMVSGALPLLLHGLKARAVELGGVFTGACGMFVLGLLDDRHELRPAAKFAGQLLVALVVAGAGLRITLFVHNQAFSYAITVLWILTLVNALNFMDNMNGLCAGLGVVGTLFFFIISAGAGQYLVALIAALACGALAGFLPYNFPRASAFLGDSGSHLVGYLLSVLAILPHFYTSKHPIVPAVLSPLLILAVPLGDLVWVVLLRWRRGQPFYVGDTNHLSHRLVQLGLSRPGAVVLIWLLAAATGSLTLIWN